MYLHFDLEKLCNADLNDVHWMSICCLNSCPYQKIHGGLTLPGWSLNF